jgi:hypothetical protein
MSVSAIRVPLIFIEIDAWAEMTVRTSVIVNQPVTINAQSAVSINGVRTQSTPILIESTSSMSVDAVLKWTPESDASTSWDAQSDTPETWTPISDNSETWQIAA